MGQISAIINFNREIISQGQRIESMVNESEKGNNKSFLKSSNSLFGITHSHQENNLLQANIEGKSYRIVLNGTIYNRAELVELLRKKGVNVPLVRDVEIILYLYHFFQQSCLNLLNGVFAFVIESEHVAFIARDQMGIKPLYYTQKNDGEWLISSQIGAIFAEGSLIPTLNAQSFLQLFALGPGLNEGESVYKNIHMLKMGHYMTITSNRNWIVRYHFLENRTHTESYEETVDHVRSLVSDAIHLQSPRESFGTFLSGGLDSSIVSAIAAQTHPNLLTFSLDYEGNAEHFKGYAYQTTRDQAYVEAMVEQIKAKHTALTISQSELASLLEEAMLARGLPGMADIDSSLLWLCRQGKKETDFILSGECADEIFGGYPWFYREDLANAHSFPWLQSTRKRTELLSDRFKNYDFIGYRDECYRNSVEEIPQLSNDSPLDQRMHRQTYLTMHGFMQTLILRQDGQSNYANLEMRVPFADIRLVDYLWNVPWSMKYRNGNEKELLREAFKDVLPREVRDRKKNPFPKTHNPHYVQIIEAMLKENLNKGDSILPFLFSSTALNELMATGGDSFDVPWFGQLMMGPQLLAYLYQIDQWIKVNHIKIEI